MPGLDAALDASMDASADATRDSTIMLMDSGMEPPPDAPPTSPPPYTTVTVGSRCTDGAVREFLVLSTGAGDCTSHAAAFTAEDSSRFVRVAIPAAGTFMAPVTMCDGGVCGPTELRVALDAGGLTGTWSATVGGTAYSVPFAATRCDFDALLPASANAPVDDLNLVEVALYQGVKITLASGGSAVSSSTPIVVGRDGLVRLFVEPAAGWVPHEVVVRVELGDGGPPIEERGYVSGPSSEADLGSTLNVTIPGERMVEGVTFAAGVYDEDPSCSSGTPTTGSARFPRTGLTALDARSMGGTFEVVLVPVRYFGDGSGRLPDTSPEQVRIFRDAMMGLYPASEVNVTVRERALDFNGGISANGSGWSSLLNECMATRNADRAPGGTYYYCLFAPSDSFRNFCSRGCVSGLGPVPSSRDTYSRASIGLGFRGSEGTFVHEVAHSLGRSHAPCGGASGADPSFPYGGGSIGVWGYDIVSGQLKDPRTHSDILGYCDTQWISDYTYSAIFSRLRSVNTSFLVAGDPVRYATLVVDVDGGLSWGAEVELVVPPTGEATSATWTAAGAALATADAIFMPVSHVDGGVLYVPLPAGGAADAVSLPAFGILAL